MQEYVGPTKNIEKDGRSEEKKYLKLLRTLPGTGQEE